MPLFYSCAFRLLPHDRLHPGRVLPEVKYQGTAWGGYSAVAERHTGTISSTSTLLAGSPQPAPQSPHAVLPSLLLTGTALLHGAHPLSAGALRRWCPDFACIDTRWWDCQPQLAGAHAPSCVYTPSPGNNTASVRCPTVRPAPDWALHRWCT